MHLRIALALFLSLTACSVDYVVRQGMGQLSIAVNRVSLDEILNDPGTPEPHRDQIRLILKVKEFSERELALTPSSNYLTFYNTSDAPVSYLVSACRKDRFEPFSWNFLLVGSVPYKGFFDIEDARAELSRMAESGYDTSLHGVAAYSTLGWFSDPVFSPMLDYPKHVLVNLIIHELVHGTVYAHGHADFNESVASFIAEQGTLIFLAREYGSDSHEYIEALRWYRDEAIYSAFIQGVHFQLDALYRSGLSKEEKLRRRSWIFMAAHDEFRRVSAHMATNHFTFDSQRMNNAEILANLRYHRREHYEPVFSGMDRDLPRFIKHAGAAAQQQDPMNAITLTAPQ